MKKIFGSILRPLVGISLACLLINRVIIHSRVNVKAEFYNSSGFLLFLAIMLYGMALLISCYRWQTLLKVQGILLGFATVFKLSMIGTFFSLVIPGAVSGDIIKMLYIAPHSKGMTAEAVLTIFLDRVLGLFGLFLVALISVLCSVKFLISANRLIQLGALAVGMGSIFLILGWAIIKYRRRVQGFPIVVKILKAGKKFVPAKIIEANRRFISALDIYRDCRQVVVKGILFSMTVHLCLSLCLYYIGQGFHETKVSINHYFLSTQVANVVGAIPITPSGIGSRDVTFKLFLEHGGADSEKAGIIPVFYTIILSFWSLIGGLFFIFLKRK